MAQAAMASTLPPPPPPPPPLGSSTPGTPTLTGSGAGTGTVLDAAALVCPDLVPYPYEATKAALFAFCAAAGLFYTLVGK